MSRKVMIPSSYRMIASGDVVPHFPAAELPVWLVLEDDGSVRWTLDPYDDETVVAS